MPNIVHELAIELSRVQALLPMLGGDQQDRARELLRRGRLHFGANYYEGMREALDDLRAFGRPETK